MGRDSSISTYFCRTVFVFCLVLVLIDFALCDKDRCNGAYAKRYGHCKCREEFAVIVKERHIREEDLGKAGLFHTIQGRKGKTRYYYCRPCSICQDGLQVISQCIGAQNTKCGQHCTDPTRIYDRATKSCQPKSFIYGVEFAEAKQAETYETIFMPNPVHGVHSLATTEDPSRDKQTRTNGWAPSNATTANNLYLSKIYTATTTNHTLPVTTVAVACSVIIAVVVVVIVCLCRRSGQDVGPSDDAEKGKSDCLEENESK
ncbi:uncharacterized protein [Ptychodera flava]|uniref:uncharacterized protein n=1 Tax=Ptychodera flava TaxID=63121 RepID=UPI00396A513A